MECLASFERTFDQNQDFRLCSSSGTKHKIIFQRHPTVDIIFVFWVQVYAGLGYMKDKTQLSSLYLFSAVGPRLSALTFSIPTITGYISVKNDSSPAIDLLENMDTYIFNEELLQHSAATGLFKYRSLSEALQIH